MFYLIESNYEQKVSLEEKLEAGPGSVNRLGVSSFAGRFNQVFST